MKIGSFPIVARTIEARASLIKQRNVGRVDVVIDGTYQDMMMVERVRPVVQAELTLRIQELDEDLRQLGVIVE